MTTAAQRTAMGDAESTNRPFTIEQHGIDFIPEAERRSRPVDLFWIWLGANVIFTYVIDGALIVGFGLGFWSALAVTLVGNVFYVLLGLTSLAGPRAGTATMAISRGAFGILGNKPASVLSWLTAVGWEAVNIVIGALALDQLAQLAGVPASTALQAACLAFVIALTFGVTIFGHATITFANRILSWVLGVGTIVLGVYVVPKIRIGVHPHLMAGTTHTGAWLLALLVMAAAPISWVNCGSDYSRYLPRATSPRRIVGWTILGGALPSVLITVVGVAAASATDMTDPVAGLRHLLPTWFFAAYLAVIVGGTVTNNFLNAYSSAMSLLALGLRIKRHQAVFIDATIGTALSIYAIFIYNFTTSFEAFLSLTTLWLVPWCGIYLADSWLRRGEYDAAQLHVTGGRYWYRGGWNPVAITWFAIGIVAGALFSSNSYWNGPLVSLVGGGDLSIFSGLLVSALGYGLSVRLRTRPAARPQTGGPFEPVTSPLAATPAALPMEQA